MDSATEDNKIALRTQIKDNFRYIYLTEQDPTVTVVTHDKLYWVRIQAKNADTWQSSHGCKTEEAALQDMSESLSDEVWQTAKYRQSKQAIDRKT
ncbi:hypothetical protein KCU81_g7365, partial [Aureobasidium melanogenum]